MTRSIPSGLRATAVVARLTARRLFRSKIISAAIVLIVIPVIFASAAAKNDEGPEAWIRTFKFTQLLLAVIPPVLLASVVAEEVHNMTFTYLWSRPIPRWSVIAGKLLVRLPVVIVIMCGGLAAAFQIAYGDAPDSTPMVRGLGAMALGCIAIGAVSVGMGSLSARFGLPIAIVYVILFDLPLGNLDFSLQNLSILHHVRQIAQVDRSLDPTGPAIAWLAGISAAWLALAVWRINRTEYTTDK